MCADAMLTRARLGPTPTEEAKEELRKYQQIQQKLNEEHNADASRNQLQTGWREGRPTEARKNQMPQARWTSGKPSTQGPHAQNAEVTFTQMCAMHQNDGEDLNTDQLRQHWNNLQMVTTDSQCETTAGYARCPSQQCALCSNTAVDESLRCSTEGSVEIPQTGGRRRGPRGSPCSAPRDVDNR